MDLGKPIPCFEINRIWRDTKNTIVKLPKNDYNSISININPFEKFKTIPIGGSPIPLDILKASSSKLPSATPVSNYMTLDIDKSDRISQFEGQKNATIDLDEIKDYIKENFNKFKKLYSTV